MAATEDIRTLSVPFAAGIAAGVLPPIGMGLLFGLAPALLVATLSLGVAMLLFRVRCRESVYALMLLTGMFAAVSSRTAGIIPLGGSSSFAFPGSRDPLTSAALGAAEGMKKVINAIPYSSSEVTGLVMALTTGDRSELPRHVTESFRAAGASHVLALSGLHLGIIYALLLWLTIPLGNAPRMRLARSVSIVCIMGFYVLATGACPSIVRAFLFIVIGESASLLHRPRLGMRTWCGALTIQLAFNPVILKSVGFQFSYLAMVGIFVVLPWLKGFYPAPSADGGSPMRVWLGRKLDLPRKLWNAAALAIACQAVTAPAVLLYFGTFPKYFLMTNLLAMPLTSLVMVLAVATVALSAIGLCPALLVSASDASVRALLFVIETIAGQDF